MMRRRPGLLSVLCGAAAALGQAPVSLPWITLAALGLGLALHGGANGPRQAALRGWALGAGYFAVALVWIVDPFLVDPVRHGWMAPFALIGLAGGLALFWGLAGWAAHWLAPRGVSGALAWAAALGLAELGRSYLLTGFPWALPGHVWIGWAPMQLAAWIGAHGLTLLTLLAAALPLAAWRAGQRPLALAAVAALAGLYGAGLWIGARPLPDGPDRADAPVIRLVQPNAPQHLKWHPDYARGFFDRQIAFTAAPAERRPDLIVWPETAVATTLERADAVLQIIRRAAGGVPVVLGLQRFEDGRAYNSLVVLDGSGAVADVYDKHHLVPFGEYIPGFALLTRLPFGAFVEEQGFGYTPGPGPRLIDLGGRLGRVLPLICYEAIFPQDMRTVAERPDWLLQITNDAWFGDWIGPYQHLAQARLRAVEQGLPMVRVANTGVSAVIDARGRVTARLPLNTEGWLDAPLPAAAWAGPTPYVRSGDWPALAAWLAILAAVFVRRRRART